MAEPQRAVAPGASVLYPVGVSVPLRTAAGTYAMQGVAYSADTDLGVSSVTSKRVTLTMGAPPPARRRRWWTGWSSPPPCCWWWCVIAVLLTGGDDDGELRNEQPPWIAGLAEVGQQLTADPGEWNRTSTTSTTSGSLPRGRRGVRRPPRRNRQRVHDPARERRPRVPGPGPWPATRRTGAPAPRTWCRSRAREIGASGGAF